VDPCGRPNVVSLVREPLRSDKDTSRGRERREGRKDLVLDHPVPILVEFESLLHDLEDHWVQIHEEPRCLSDQVISVHLRDGGELSEEATGPRDLKNKLWSQILPERHILGAQEINRRREEAREDRDLEVVDVGLEERVFRGRAHIVRNCSLHLPGTRMTLPEHDPRSEILKSD
jgi:hypothetical protein